MDRVGVRPMTKNTARAIYESSCCHDGDVMLASTFVLFLLPEAEGLLNQHKT